MNVFSELLALGQPTRGDAVVTSMLAKSGTTFKPGDLVKIAETSAGSDPKQVEADKVSAATDCIYGVVTFGIHNNIIPIVTSGHVIAHINSSTFTNMSVGQGLCKIGKCQCGIILVQKINALKEDGSKESSAYELKL